MKRNYSLALSVILAAATIAGAQVKVSGTSRCGKPDAQHMVEVGDAPNHSFSISQGKCAWTKPFDIDGVQNKEGLDTSFSESTGNRARVRGFFLDTMANGDKGHYRYEATGTLKDGMFQTAEAKWTLAGGTGKLKGAKGKGTCKGKGESDGTVNWECEGELVLAK